METHQSIQTKSEEHKPIDLLIWASDLESLVDVVVRVFLLLGSHLESVEEGALQLNHFMRDVRFTYIQYRVDRIPQWLYFQLERS